MNKEQAEFLEDKLAKLCEKQPRFRILSRRLLEIGGVQVVAPTAPDPELDQLLEDGFLHPQKPVLEESEANGCHANSAALWLQEHIDAIGTGYCLSEDGLWRQHSWGLRKEQLIETTELRTVYFGLRMEAEEADNFAARCFEI